MQYVGIVPGSCITSLDLSSPNESRTPPGLQRGGGMMFFVRGKRKGRMWRHVFMINNTIVNCHHQCHYDRNFTIISIIFIITLNVPFASWLSSSSRRHHMSSSSSSSRCHPFSLSCLLLFQRDGLPHKAIILQWYMHGIKDSIKCRWTTACLFITIQNIIIM